MWVAKPICSSRRGVTVGERNRRDESIRINKGRDSAVSLKRCGPGKGRIITGPAGARLGHVPGRCERSERRTRSKRRNTGNLPTTNDRPGDLVFGVKRLPFSKRHPVRIKGVYEVRLIRGGEVLFLDICCDSREWCLAP